MFPYQTCTNSMASIATQPSSAPIGVPSSHSLWASVPLFQALQTALTRGTSAFRSKASTCKPLLHLNNKRLGTDRLPSFAIGYMYSFVAAGLCYWVLMRFVPEHESRMDHEVTGEEILHANDERKARQFYKDEKKGLSVRNWLSKRSDSDSSVA